MNNYKTITNVAFEVKDMESSILQYKNLRHYFNEMVINVLGDGYYNMGMDVYECDKETCEAITRRANRKWYERLIEGIKFRGTKL